jgi:uncharacterized cupredoxin-like copper-binding protein
VKRAIFVTIIALLSLGLAACGDDSTSSTSPSSDDSGGGVSVPADESGTTVNIEVGDTSDTEQFLKATPGSVPAGMVTFVLTNTGLKAHEMLVLKTDTPAADIEVGTDHRISEAESLGEIGETAVGATGTLTLDLEPGHYVLACNVEKHYEQGMHIDFTVE